MLIIIINGLPGRCPHSMFCTKYHFFKSMSQTTQLGLNHRKNLVSKNPSQIPHLVGDSLSPNSAELLPNPTFFFYFFLPCGRKRNAFTQTLAAETRVLSDWSKSLTNYRLKLSLCRRCSCPRICPHRRYRYRISSMQKLLLSKETTFLNRNFSRSSFLGMYLDFDCP